MRRTNGDWIEKRTKLNARCERIRFRKDVESKKWNMKHAHHQKSYKILMCILSFPIDALVWNSVSRAFFCIDWFPHENFYKTVKHRYRVYLVMIVPKKLLFCVDCVWLMFEIFSGDSSHSMRTTMLRRYKWETLIQYKKITLFCCLSCALSLSLSCSLA